MNKYRPGGRCGGDTPSSSSNPEFNSSLASLLQKREQQDALFSAPTPTSVPLQQKPQKKELVIIQTTPKPSKDAYIQLLLEGDYE